MPDLPTFKFVHVRCTRADSLLVRWALTPTAYPLDKIAFEVFRSQGQDGPWDLVSEIETGSFHYYDFDVEGPTSMRTWYYRVRVASTVGDGYTDSEPVYLVHDPDNIALEMIRKKNVSMVVKNGVALAALVRKQWGSKCSRCWHPERQLPADADCPICFGTGYNDGYCKPLLMTGIVPAPRTVAAMQMIGRVEPSEELIELSNNPWVGVDDLIVDRVVGTRYHVNRVVQYTHRGYPVSQLCTATKLDDNHVAYSIPVPETSASIGGKSWDLVKV